MLDVIYRLVAYNLWANRKLINWLSVSADRNVEASQLLVHSLLEEKISLAHLRGVEASAIEPPPGRSIEQCEACLAEIQDQYSVLLAGLVRDNSPKRPETLDTTDDQIPPQDALIHLISHADYNRGLVAASVRSRGLLPPETDYLTFLRETTGSASMLLSVVIPVYNESAVLPSFLSALTDALSKIECRYELIFVDDGSQDDSVKILSRAAISDTRVKILVFSRNFGHQAAITAGLDFASGDAVVIMDADLQDPPEILPRMVELYRQGYDVVSAQRVGRKGDGVFKRTTARLFYGMMTRGVDRRLVPDVGDYRLFSRAAVVSLCSLREQHRFIRGMVAWLGLKETTVPFDRPARTAGVTKYSFWKMLRFAWTAISSFSGLPLRLSLIFGAALTATGFLYLAFAVYAALVLRITYPGWTSLVALQVIFSGSILMAIGLLGDYIARIYEESKGRPLYVLARTINSAVPVGDLRGALVVPDRRIGEPQHTPYPRDEHVSTRVQKYGS